MAIRKIVTGDDIAIISTLKKNDVPVAINAGAIVKAALVNRARTKKIIGDTSLSEATAGADYANGNVVVVFSSIDTLGITDIGAARIEIQVADPLKQTYGFDVTIEKGLID